jgi:hypothetical protein
MLLDGPNIISSSVSDGYSMEDEIDDREEDESRNGESDLISFSSGISSEESRGGMSDRGDDDEEDQEFFAIEKEDNELLLSLADLQFDANAAGDGRDYAGTPLLLLLLLLLLPLLLLLLLPLLLLLLLALFLLSCAS